MRLFPRIRSPSKTPVKSEILFHRPDKLCENDDHRCYDEQLGRPPRYLRGHHEIPDTVRHERHYRRGKAACDRAPDVYFLHCRVARAPAQHPERDDDRINGKHRSCSRRKSSSALTLQPDREVVPQHRSDSGPCSCGIQSAEDRPRKLNRRKAFENIKQQNDGADKGGSGNKVRVQRADVAAPGVSDVNPSCPSNNQMGCRNGSENIADEE